MILFAIANYVSALVLVAFSFVVDNLIPCSHLFSFIFSCSTILFCIENIMLAIRKKKKI